ncbi:GNAT family N-acetyltransferase [Paenibacillus sp. SI8]|uniref:GNAT family N-acetyltransferase n=1 Tax=unclassified Paenibacillus TaxID=185978 RepID=UPI0034658B2C
MNEVEIRWATFDDCLQIGQVHNEAYISAYESMIPETYLRMLTSKERQFDCEHSLRNGLEKTAIILVDGIIIGLLILGVGKEKEFDETFAEIKAIYLLKPHWGKGYGKKLLNWGLSRLRELGYLNVYLWVLKENTNAIHVYNKMGFRFDGEERLIERGKECIQLRCSMAIRA